MRFRVIIAMLMVLAGCSAQGPSPRPDKLSQPAQPLSAPQPEGQRFQVDQAGSEVRIISYPSSRLGHSHVIGGQVLSGEIVVPEDHQRVWLDLSVNVRDLEVDNTAWRQDEQFEPDISERAKNGTKQNMLSDKLLHAERYPTIHIQAQSATGPHWQKDIAAYITLAGETRKITVPVAVFERDKSLDVIGHFQIRQSDFGITPFSALGGILQVDDKVLIRFRIHANAR